MKNFKLNDEQRHELKARHKKCRNLTEGDRIKAVILWSDGWTVEKIAEALLIDESNVRRHIKEYVDSGKLKKESGGSEGHMTSNQSAELVKHLESNPYVCSYKIVSYVWARFGVHFSISGMNKWLHRHGFAYEKPKGFPYKADVDMQADCIEDYQGLKRSIPEEEKILFADGVPPTQATKITYGWRSNLQAT